jgi:hypothetical protein
MTKGPAVNVDPSLQVPAWKALIGPVAAGTSRAVSPLLGDTGSMVCLANESIAQHLVDKLGLTMTPLDNFVIGQLDPDD